MALTVADSASLSLDSKQWTMLPPERVPKSEWVFAIHVLTAHETQPEHQLGLFEGWDILALALPMAVQQVLYCSLLLLLLPACLPWLESRYSSKVAIAVAVAALSSLAGLDLLTYLFAADFCC